jgi:hypothetical protein
MATDNAIIDLEIVNAYRTSLLICSPLNRDYQLLIAVLAVCNLIQKKKWKKKYKGTEDAFSFRQNRSATSRAMSTLLFEHLKRLPDEGSV